MKDIGKPFPCTSLCSSIMDSVADGVFCVDQEWNITYFNRSAEKITGVAKGQAVDRKCWEVFKVKDCRESCVLRSCLENNAAVPSQILTITRNDGREVNVSVSAAALKDHHGRIIGGVETFRDLSVPLDAQPVCGWTPPLDFRTRDPQLLELLRILPQIAESEATVLLQGESGTGKELFSRAIHRLSQRAKAPFVAVNCGALPAHLMESELFGYKAGAFTDARHDKPGRFAMAEGGTLLLDEIGDLPYALQSKILRVLQERVYEPLGAVNSIAANVRVVAATNLDLSRMVDEGTFRRDLYYRLNVVPLKLPPLRERIQDIPLLADSILRRRMKNHASTVTGATPEVLHLLMRYDFPGNIRELENILEYACIMCHGGLIQVEHLPQWLHDKCLPHGHAAGMTMEEIRYLAALKAVERNGGNRNAACRELDITKDTLRRILRRQAVG